MLFDRMWPAEWARTTHWDSELNLKSSLNHSQYRHFFDSANKRRTSIFTKRRKLTNFKNLSIETLVKEWARCFYRFRSLSIDHLTKLFASYAILSRSRQSFCEQIFHLWRTIPLEGNVVVWNWDFEGRKEANYLK